MAICSQSTGCFSAYDDLSTKASSRGVLMRQLVMVIYLQQSMSKPSRLVSMVTLSMVERSQPVMIMPK